MRIDLLCSGSKGNSCLIRHEDTQLLIDCGSTKKYLMESFKKVGACVDDTNGVLISHAHSDHVSQLKHFKHLDVYSYCDLKDALDKHDVVPNQKLIIKDLSIQFLGLSHDSPHTIGFVVESDKEKLVYVTDTGYVPNQIKPYIANADHYIFESNHDVDRLMHTNRPMFLKQRILSDNGHLNNEDSSLNLPLSRSRISSFSSSSRVSASRLSTGTRISRQKGLRQRSHTSSSVVSAVPSRTRASA